MESSIVILLGIAAVGVAALAKRTSSADASTSDWAGFEGPTDIGAEVPVVVPPVVVPPVVVQSPQSIQDIIRSTAARFHEDAALMLAVAQTESSFNAAAVNLNDPSYGLYQIQVFWLKFFGFPGDKNLLLDPATACEVAARILAYFRSRQNPLTGDTFQFPADIDVYNVGETLWAQGKRNIGYRDRVTRYYRSFGGTR